ncbi:MAG: DUF1643 domain-containing protein [Gammaproteobacteria bacterium]|nr:DUF1643 domain-containing protein [Gammaproteobacteria bacterium]
MRRLASFSRCKRYRYSLTRSWNPSLPKLMLVGLNPSRADARTDDPTIRRCIGLSDYWGYGSFTIVNLFSWCSPYPGDLRRQADPVGPGTNQAIRRTALQAEDIVLMWGNHGQHRDRADQVLQILQGYSLRCIGQTATGAPRHLLYARKDASLVGFNRSVLSQ